MKERIYRIITNGRKYRVQQQGRWGRWYTEGYGGGYNFFRPEEFDTREEAEQYIIRQQTPAPMHEAWITT